jgi:magnesium chelatase family protein
MSTRQMRRFCELAASSRRLLEHAVERLGLSARGYDRVLKVSRTIADLAGTEQVNSAHIAEAVHYRALDRAYFKV